MFATERRQIILEFVRVKGTASLRDIAAAVNSSEVTVRRDIRRLDEEGLLDRRRGGAVWPGGLSHEPSYRQKSQVAAAEKAAIARLAATMVDEGDAIFLGAGTTTQKLATALSRTSDLTVVTNSVLVAQVLAASKAEVVVTGGSLRGSTFSLVGSVAEQSLAKVRVRYAFLSGNGLTAERGLSTPNILAAGMDTVIAHCAHEVVVLADRTKLGVDTMFQTVPVEAITHLVTDDGADPEQVRRLEEAGVRVHVAPVAASVPASRATDQATDRSRSL